ncbi:MAG: sensor domain-containing diguanylate cyclase [Desulfobulbaceae bacterium]|nr:sensor domain-containing diguanylate cyclase [Desulfobulbaceae bacterium]
MYLLIEAILHVTIYHGDGLLSGLLPLDDPHELWMRMVTFVLFVTFGIVIDVVLTRLRLANQERDRLVEQLAKRAHDLGERVKELSCLYGIDELAGKEEFTITDFIAGTVCLIPNSWQYPEITEGRIIYKGKTFETKHFKKTEWLQAADIVIGKETVGTIEVCYTKKMSERYEGPFLEEERNLINSIASRLSRIIRRKQVEDILQKDRWRLQSILNGTNVGTWEWNIESGETVFNERWAEIIGYSLEEISPVSIETWMEYANPVDLKDSNQLLERHFKGELEYYEVECRMKHKDGYWVWVFDRGKVFSWTDEGKPLMMFGTHQDISERKRTELALIRSEQKFQQLSKHDAMTGLLNRRGWNECIKDEEAWGRRYGYQSCVVIVDLDGLKKINDNHGHKAGDELIRSAAHCLRKTIRDVDKLARIGGDEFAILGVEYKGEDVDVLLKRIEIALSEKGVKASWGAAMSKTGSGIEDTIAEADQVMYKMKEGRRTTR